MHAAFVKGFLSGLLQGLHQKSGFGVYKKMMITRQGQPRNIVTIVIRPSFASQESLG